MENAVATVSFQAVGDFWLGITGLVAGVVSIVMGAFALALSVYFFVQAKRAESEAAKALEGIRSQTQTLAELSGQQLRGLTRIVADQVKRPERGLEKPDVFLAVLEKLTVTQRGSLLEPGGQPTVQTHGDTIQNPGIPLLAPVVDREGLKDLSATAMLAIYFYSAYANFFGQSHLPSEANYDEANEFHRLTRMVLDLSAADSRVVANALDQWNRTDPAYVSGHKLNGVFGAEGKKVSALVRSARQTFEFYAKPPDGP